MKHTTRNQQAGRTLGVMAALAVGCLAASGCDSTARQTAERQADALEERADAVRAEGEFRADALEDQADALDQRLDGVDPPAEQRLENQADAVRDAAEARADALENQADAVRDTPR